MISSFARRTSRLILVGSLWACGGASETAPVTPPPAVPIAATIEVSVSTTLVIIGFPTSAAAAVRDTEGKLLSSIKPRWAVRDTSVAQIDGEGRIDGKRIGSAIGAVQLPPR